VQESKFVSPVKAYSLLPHTHTLTRWLAGWHFVCSGSCGCFMCARGGYALGSNNLSGLPSSNDRVMCTFALSSAFSAVVDECVSCCWVFLLPQLKKDFTVSFLSDRTPFTQFHSDLSKSAVRSTHTEDDLIYQHIYFVSLTPFRIYHVFPSIIVFSRFSNAFPLRIQSHCDYADFQSVQLNKVHYCRIRLVIPMRGAPPKIPLILSNLRVPLKAETFVNLLRQMDSRF
jgi:hypothetical protein